MRGPIGNILGNDWLRSLLINYGRKFLNRHQYDREFLLKRLLRKLKVNIIFAEYGQTAVHSLKICKELDLPLIVHFHGFDAFKKHNQYHHSVQYAINNIIDIAYLFSWKQLFDEIIPFHDIELLIIYQTVFVSRHMICILHLSWYFNLWWSSGEYLRGSS